MCDAWGEVVGEPIQDNARGTVGGSSNFDGVEWDGCPDIWRDGFHEGFLGGEPGGVVEESGAGFGFAVVYLVGKEDSLKESFPVAGDDLPYSGDLDNINAKANHLIHRLLSMMDYV